MQKAKILSGLKKELQLLRSEDWVNELQAAPSKFSVEQYQQSLLGMLKGIYMRPK